MTTAQVSEFKPNPGLVPAEERLHALAHILAMNNLNANIQANADTLKFLKEIEFKTAEDIEKVEESKKILDILQSDEYFNALRNTFAEHYAKLPPRFVERYLEDIEYEQAISEVGLTLVPAMYKLRDDFCYGVVSKPTLQ